jgi:hypothetical protein
MVGPLSIGLLRQMLKIIVLALTLCKELLTASSRSNFSKIMDDAR